MIERRRVKRTTRQYIIVALICILVIGGASVITVFLTVNQVRQEYRQQLDEVKREKSENQRVVYTATKDIAAGDLIKTDIINKITVYASQPQETYMGDQDIGKIALLDIPNGTHIQSNMLTGTMVSVEQREVEYDVILLNTNIVDEDYVDVRIMFPNGEDYIVLSKKTIKGFEADSSRCFLWLSEEEILRMASAMVDAYLYAGAKIYTTKYIEPNLQEGSFVTYKPSISTQLLLQDNPNIIETAENELSKQVRKAMENRLAASFSVKVEEIDWALSTNGASAQEEIPAAFNPNSIATYRDELEVKQDEIDYGP